MNDYAHFDMRFKNMINLLVPSNVPISFFIPAARWETDNLLTAHCGIDLSIRYGPAAGCILRNPTTFSPSYNLLLMTAAFTIFVID